MKDANHSAMLRTIPYAIKDFFVCPTNPQVHTNTIERQWRIVKETVKTVSDDLRIDAYLAEHIYRRRYLHPLGEYGPQFKRFCADIVNVYPGPNKVKLDFLTE